MKRYYEGKLRSIGFTLVELLVVIAIISLLAGLLIPAIARGSAVARRSRCAGNLRQMILGVMLYTADEGKYPSVQLISSTPFGLNQTWFVRLEPYILSRKQTTRRYPVDEVFFCTEGHFKLLKLDVGPGVDNVTNLPFQAYYGYNSFGGANPLWAASLRINNTLGLAQNCSEASVAMPSEMIALACSSARGPNILSRWISPEGGEFAVGSWHLGRVNVSFCDGHVSLESPERISEAGDPMRSLWNNDHQPHPESW